MEGNCFFVSSALSLEPEKMVELQVQELESQIMQLRQLLARQVEMTGNNPLEEELVALAKGTKRAGRWDTLSATAIETLVGVYGLKDFLSKAEIQELCALVGTTPSHVKAFFTDLRKIARDELSGPEKVLKARKLMKLDVKSKRSPHPSTIEGASRRLGRAASAVRRLRPRSLAGVNYAKSTTSGAEKSKQLLQVASIRKKPVTSDLMPIDVEPESEEEQSEIGVRVLELLSKSSCLPKHWEDSATGSWSGNGKSILLEMKETASVLGMERLAEAICTLPQGSLPGLCHEGIVQYLARWMQEAVVDEQTTLLRHLLKALESLPLDAAPQVDIGLASSALQRVCKYHVPGVAGGATALLQRICPHLQKVGQNKGLSVAGRKHTRCAIRAVPLTSILTIIVLASGRTELVITCCEEPKRDSHFFVAFVCNTIPCALTIWIRVLETFTQLLNKKTESCISNPSEPPPLTPLILYDPLEVEVFVSHGGFHNPHSDNQYHRL